MRRRTHEDFAEEIASHLELEIDRFVGEGMTRDQARDAALKSFGPITQRTREVGIRMALGATAHVVVSLVVRQSVRLAGLGAAAA